MKPNDDSGTGYRKAALGWSPDPFSTSAAVAVFRFLVFRTLVAIAAPLWAFAIHPGAGVVVTFISIYYFRRRWIAAKWLYRIKWLDRPVSLKATKLAKAMDDALQILDTQFEIREIRIFLEKRESKYPQSHASQWEFGSEVAEQAFDAVSHLIQEDSETSLFDRHQALKKELESLRVKYDRERLKREITAEVRREFEGR
jgi:hypothetical protein